MKNINNGSNKLLKIDIYESGNNGLIMGKHAEKQGMVLRKVRNQFRKFCYILYGNIWKRHITLMFDIQQKFL